MVPPTSTRKRSSAGSTGPVTANFRPFVEKGRWAAKKGTLPLPEPTTVTEILTKVVLHTCRKVLFLDPKIRLMIYAIMLFFFSLVADYMPFPKTYFANKNNFLNLYFVKFSWAWTFVLTGMFMYLTSSTYTCGNRDRVIRHMLRLVVGTLIWFGWTTMFQSIEESTGQCVMDQSTISNSIKSRRTCVSKSGQWMSFDISGHSFLLIWCVFFISEEAKAIIGWDNIKEFIRTEEYNRSKAGQSSSQQQPGSSGEAASSASVLSLGETPLNVLSDDEFMELKARYSVYNVPAKITLIFMTLLSIIWDFMVLMTSIYFHVMIEKVLGGFAASFTWFVFYRGVYKCVSYIGLPGQGLFKYNSESTKTSTTTTKSSLQTTSSSLSSSSTSKAKSGGSSIGRTKAKEPDDIGNAFICFKKC